MRVRNPAVVGSFYPASADEVRHVVEACLEEAKADGGKVAPKALIVPHAGYIYSGPIAGSAYAQLRTAHERIHTVVIVGPSHRSYVRGLAFPEAERFRTPLGEIAVSSAARKTVTGFPQVVINDSPHEFEHSLEVQLPFLQMILDDFSIAPLAVGEADAQEVAEVLHALWGGPETLIVISSDLSHYLAYATAKHVDEETAAKIISLRSHINHEQACGATGVNGLIEAASRHPMRVELLDLRNSGGTAGDRDRVVGYGAFAFYEEKRSG